MELSLFRVLIYDFQGLFRIINYIRKVDLHLKRENKSLVLKIVKDKAS